MSKAAYLTTQLRECAPYLKDAGWHQTAKLVCEAADELDTLRALLDEFRPRIRAMEANENERVNEKRKARGSRI